MLNIKKAISLLLSLVLMFTFAACSEMDPDYGQSEKSNSAESAEEKSNYDENAKIMSSDRVMSNFFDISLFDEENYADIYLGKKFKIDATPINDVAKVSAHPKPV